MTTQLAAANSVLNSPSSRCRRVVLAGLLVVAALGWANPVLGKQHVVVVLDDSGSMDDRMRSARRIRKMDAAKQALLTVLQQLPPESELGIVLLNGRQRGSPWLVPLGLIDLATAQQAIRQVQAGGGTPLGEFLKVGADALLRQRAKHHYGDYRLLVVTDGEATDPHLVDRYLPDILTRGFTVDVIGVAMAEDHSLATRVHSYRRADDLESLVRALEEVLAETGGLGSDAQEADYEWLRPLDDGVAAAMLAALAESGNEPIEGEMHAADGRDSARDRTGNTSSRRRPSSFSVVIFLALFMSWYVISKTLRRQRSIRRE